jgi:hypothetical protein
MKTFFSLLVVSLTGLGIFVNRPQEIPKEKVTKQSFLQLSQLPETNPQYYAGIPNPQRGEEFRRFLAPSVKIGLSRGSGSGTICYYDHEKNLAYVATCGHLWDWGKLNEEEAAKQNLKCKIIVFYHNAKKLLPPKEYEGTVLFYSYVRGCDTGLVSFKPDWIPDYFPIAPVNYQIKVGSRQHSCGCDEGTEVAHYDVEIVGLQEPDLVTIENSPRPGRSGGGMLSDDGYYIATCWGTYPRDGTGVGYFTPLSVIHQFWIQQPSYRFLLNIEKELPGQLLPVVDRMGGVYKRNYILIPSVK